MYFSSYSVFKAAAISVFALEAGAVVLRPIVTVPNNPAKPPVKRDDGPPGVQFVPIRDPGEITGKFTKREKKGNSCYDPSSENEFLWGAYGKLSSDQTLHHM